MPVANIKLIKHLIDTGRLVYGVLKTDATQARPLELTDNGNLPVEIKSSADADVDASSVTKDMDGQAPGSVNVTNVDQVIIPADANRVAIVLCNDSDEVMYIGVDEATAANNGIRLNANGGSFTMSKWGPIHTTSDIHGIHGGAGNKVLTYQSFY